MCRTCGKRHNSYDADPSSGGTQDVSLEAVGSIPFSFGLRSPGKVSPLRGRNMREYEEHLEHLKKENFALKLRIYFLEERMGQKGMKEDKDDLYKANIELKVETEALKKELWDKQELVRQASALLTTLEHQYKDQLHQAKENHERDTEDLKAKIFVLEKEVEDYSERCRHEGGDLTQLCGLAFCTGEEGNSMVPGHQNANIAMRNLPYMGSTSPLQGIFSLQDNVATPAIERNYCNNPLMISNMNNQEEEEYIPDSAKRRIRVLEGEVENLKCKVQDLQKELGVKERISLALEEDISNLKKEIAEREDKMIDLETEVNEKDQKVDQLMQELETRHLEIQAKDSKIQTLHDDLNKVEPEIEIKVQEIIERDKIIEEKIEQLQQQNKILVEIQITLDEKQKQIAELEANLLDAQQKVEKLNKDFELSLATIQGLADEVMSRDKEILQLKKELKKKEKKVRDLVAELKEALDMLKKAKWEAETSGGEDGVKEMVEEENEVIPQREYFPLKANNVIAGGSGSYWITESDLFMKNDLKSNEECNLTSKLWKEDQSKKNLNLSNEQERNKLTNINMFAFETISLTKYNSTFVSETLREGLSVGLPAANGVQCCVDNYFEQRKLSDSEITSFYDIEEVCIEQNKTQCF